MTSIYFRPSEISLNQRQSTKALTLMKCGRSGRVVKATPCYYSPVKVFSSEAQVRILWTSIFLFFSVFLFLISSRSSSYPRYVFRRQIPSRRRYEWPRVRSMETVSFRVGGAESTTIMTPVVVLLPRLLLYCMYNTNLRVTSCSRHVNMVSTGLLF